MIAVLKFVNAYRIEQGDLETNPSTELLGQITIVPSQHSDRANASFIPL